MPIKEHHITSKELRSLLAPTAPPALIEKVKSHVAACSDCGDSVVSSVKDALQLRNNFNAAAELAGVAERKEIPAHLQEIASLVPPPHWTGIVENYLKERSKKYGTVGELLDLRDRQTSSDLSDRMGIGQAFLQKLNKNRSLLSQQACKAIDNLADGDYRHLNFELLTLAGISDLFTPLFKAYTPENIENILKIFGALSQALEKCLGENGIPIDETELFKMWAEWMEAEMYKSLTEENILQNMAEYPHNEPSPQSPKERVRALAEGFSFAIRSDESKQRDREDDSDQYCRLIRVLRYICLINSPLIEPISNFLRGELEYDRQNDEGRNLTGYSLSKLKRLPEIANKLEDMINSKPYKDWVRNR